MALTWAQYKTNLKVILSDVTASDDLFAQACSYYVRYALAREVDHDLQLSKSFWNDFVALRRRLLGYNTTLVAGSTLDTAVSVYLPVDSQREGMSTYIAQLVKNAYQEIKTLDVFIERLMREAAIDLQSHIPCYRVLEETSYTSADVTNVGNFDRGAIPEQAELYEGYLLRPADVLAEGVAYAPCDFVASNGRIYKVITGGTLGAGELGAGLTYTDNQVQTLGGLTFQYFYGEACFRSRLKEIEWKERHKIAYLRDGCTSSDQPAIIALDPTSYSFFIWPKLDATHTVELVWSGLKFDFIDSDQVPFDENVADASRHYILSKYYAQVEENSPAAKLHSSEYFAIRSRLFVDCKARQRIQW